VQLSPEVLQSQTQRSQPGIGLVQLRMSPQRSCVADVLSTCPSGDRTHFITDWLSWVLIGAANLAICDRIRDGARWVPRSRRVPRYSDDPNPRRLRRFSLCCSPVEAVKMLVQRLDHGKPAVQILALKLAETMMKNLSGNFHRQMANPDVMKAMKALGTGKKNEKDFLSRGFASMTGRGHMLMLRGSKRKSRPKPSCLSRSGRRDSKTCDARCRSLPTRTPSCSGAVPASPSSRRRIASQRWFQHHRLWEEPTQRNRCLPFHQPQRSSMVVAMVVALTNPQQRRLEGSPRLQKCEGSSDAIRNM
jgi:hypothetical protein